MATQTFTSSDSWVVPTNVLFVTAQVWAGGGGGGVSSQGEGGGGGGEYLTSIVAVTPGNSMTVTVGAGGAAGSNGADSWFSAPGSLSAKGGTAGSGRSGGAGGNTTGPPLGVTVHKGGNGAASSGGGAGGGGGGSSGGTAAIGNNGSANSGSTGGAGGIAPTGGSVGRAGGNNNANGGTASGFSCGGGGGGASATASAGLAGKVTLTWDYDHIATGGVSFGGTATVAFVEGEADTFDYDGLLELDIGGTGTLLHEWDVATPTGGLSLGGGAAIDFQAPFNEFTIIPEGGMGFAGAAAVVAEYLGTVSGGMQLGGTAAILREYDITPTSGIALAGSAVSEFVPTPLTPPAAPSGLSANQFGVLAWVDNANNEDSFQAEYDLVDSFDDSPTNISSIPADSVLYSVPGLAAGTEYFFRIRAVNGAGASDWSNTASATIEQAAIFSVFGSLIQ